MSFPEVVAQLFDAEAEPTDPEVVHDTMEVVVGDVQVQVHRTAPFTETEHARATAMAALVNDVLRRTREAAAFGVPSARRLGADEILLTTRSDNQAVLPMVLGAGLRGRIRMAADELTVRVPVGGLKPLGR